MATPIDIRTLCLAGSASVLSLAVATTYVWRRRRTYAGFGTWVVAAWCSFAGLALLTLQEVWPDSLTIVGAQTLLCAGSALVVAGLRTFTGGRVAPSIYTALLMAVLLLSAGLRYLHPSFHLRMGLFLLATGAFCFRGAVLAWRGLPAVLARPNGLVLFTLATLALFYGLLGLATLGFPPGTTRLHAPASLPSLALLAALMGHASLFAGLIVLNGQRVERDLQASLDDYHRLRGLIPICAACKKIRDDHGEWDPLESYLHQHAGVDFTHGLCPDCATAYGGGVPRSGSAARG
jgi:hypothetical protein